MNAINVNNKTRRRREQHQHLHHYHIMASLLITLSATAVAFQSSLFPSTPRIHRDHHFHRQCYIHSRLAVLKDPDMLVKEDLFLRRDSVNGKKQQQQKQQQQQRKEKSLKSLENAYFSSPYFHDDSENHIQQQQQQQARSHRVTPVRSKPSASSAFVDRPRQLQQSQPILSVRQRKRSQTQIQSTTTSTAPSATTMAMADGYQLNQYHNNNIDNNINMDDVVTNLMPAVAPFTPPPPISKSSPSVSTTTTKPSSSSSSSLPMTDILPEQPTESSITASTGVQFKTTRKRRRATMKIATSTSGAATNVAATRIDQTSNLASSSSSSSLLTSSSTTSQPKTATVSKSSTMPGFVNRGMTGKEKAFRDGLRLAELRSGKNLAKAANSVDARKNRRKLNGETMYKNSASVPDSLVKFAHEIHEEDRITHWEEKELGVKTQEALRLQNLYDHLVSTLDREPTDEEWCAAAGKINMEAITQSIQEGIDAKNKLVTANLRMVQACVNLYIRNGLGGQYNAGDMMQEGIMALIRAAEKFEPERGFRFSTYAMYWIRSAVKRSQIFQSRVITVPQRLYENHKRVLRTQRELRLALGRMPSNQELGHALGMSAQQVDRCLDAMAQRCYSLDQQVVNRMKPTGQSAQRGDSTMLDLVEGSREDGESQKQARSFLKEDLIETMKRYLKDDEVHLLLLRYGLVDDSDDSPLQQNVMGGPKSIAEVSDLVGLKPDKVRRIIDKSLKLLNAQIGNEWRDFERELQ